MQRPMPRRLVVAALALGAFLPAVAQPRVYRIGFIGSSPVPPAIAALRERLAELGYVEGKNLVFEERYAGASLDRLSEVITGSLASNVDVLVVGSTPVALAVKRATTTVPIAFAGLFDPVGSGIVASLARPGGNITGASIGVGGAGLGGKWLELLKEAVPSITQVAVLANLSNPASAASVREIEAAARILKVKVEVHDATTPEDLDRAFDAIGTSDAQGLIVSNDPFFNVNRVKLVQFAARKRLPAMYFFDLFAEAGGLMVYGASLVDSYRKAAAYVDRILKGARPGDLPVEQPTRFELVVNLKTAKALGLTIPQRLLLRADRVIE